MNKKISKKTQKNTKKHQKNKQKIDFSLIKKFFKLAKPFKGLLFAAIIFALINSVAEAMVPIFIGKAVDSLIGKGLVNYVAMFKNLILIAVLALLAFSFGLAGKICLHACMYKTIEEVRNKFFEKINSVPIKYIDRSTHGDLLNRMMFDVNMMSDGFLESVGSATDGLFSLVSTLILMIVLNFKIALIVLCLTPLSFLTTLYIAKKAQYYFDEKAKIDGEISGYLEEYISGQRVVKAFGHEKKSVENFMEINGRRYEVAHRSEFMATITGPVTRAINWIVYLIVGFVGVMLCLKGEPGMSVGVITSFLTYANTFGKPFAEIADEITDIQSAFASGARVFAVLDEENEVSDANLPMLKKFDGSVQIKDVSFSYVEGRKLLENLNVDIKPGQKVAIVGPTGCGKTTIINLLMRFYDVQKGAIMLQGTDIKTIKRKSLRSQYGMVLQESWLFSASVADNIAYGVKHATRKQIVEVAKKAGAYDFIMQMPQGFDTLITEGASNISAGQKQLLCIARIMLMNPKVLILDEATSNIDTRTEQKIQQAFDILMKGRTSFVIAHRLSTITNSDLILVMNKGNVIETGTHKQLLAKKGFYANLYNSQFEK